MYCEQHVCLSVCLSARMSRKPHVQISQNFLHVLPEAMARSFSDANAINYVLPVLWTALCLHIVQGLVRSKDDAYVSSISPRGGTGGGKSAVSDCMLLDSAIQKMHNRLRLSIFLLPVLNLFETRKPQIYHSKSHHPTDNQPVLLCFKLC